MSKEQAGLFDFDPDNVGDEIVCGVDEAGRGPLAGPVFAAAVELEQSRRAIKLPVAIRIHQSIYPLVELLVLL